MAQSAALIVLPSGDRTGPEEEALRLTAALLTQSVEDLRLAERVQCALRSTGHRELRNTDVTVQTGVVTLIGRVSSCFLKQLAQTAVQGVTGIQRIQNDLVVL
jgi:osmotically-inducible protein OsmY